MTDNRTIELLQKLRDLADDHVSIMRTGWPFDAQWLDARHMEFDRIADELEQAIAATLGRPTSAGLTELLDEFEHECYMLRVEASETRARDDVVRKSYERILDEFAGRIAATLGSEREKALEELMRDWRACDPKCTNRSCGDCEHDEDDGCGLYRRMCELGVIA